MQTTLRPAAVVSLHPWGWQKPMRQLSQMMVLSAKKRQVRGGVPFKAYKAHTKACSVPVTLVFNDQQVAYVCFLCAL